MSDERIPMLGQSTSLYVVKMLEMKKIKTAEWMKNVPPQTLKAYLELIEEFGQGLAFEEEMEEIRKKWREQGLQEGLREGRQEGIEIGAQEAKKTVVVNLLHAFPDLAMLILLSWPIPRRKWWPKFASNCQRKSTMATRIIN